jgi:hypothetical protein
MVEAGRLPTSRQPLTATAPTGLHPPEELTRQSRSSTARSKPSPWPVPHLLRPSRIITHLAHKILRARAQRHGPVPGLALVHLCLQLRQPVTNVDEPRGRAVLHGGIELGAVERDALGGPAGERRLEVERDRVEWEGGGVGAAGAGMSV